MSHVNRISHLTHVLPILPRVGLWLWVSVAHRGSLRQMQQGLWLYITLIRDYYNDLLWKLNSIQVHSLLF